MRNAVRGAYSASKLSSIMAQSHTLKCPPLPSTLWAEVFRSCSSWPADSRLFEQGEPAVNVFWVEDGVVGLMRTDAAGHESIVDLKQRASIVGLAATLTGEPYSAAAAVLCRTTLRWCTIGTFRAAVAGDDRLRREIDRMLGSEIDALGRRIQMLTQNSRTRLIEFLRSQTDENPRSKCVSPVMKHADIASFIGVTPEHLSRIVRQLCDAGQITSARGRLVLVSPTANEATSW